MSYIRMGQEGSYVDIPGGSKYYLYYNGTDIEGWTKAEFAGILFDYIEERLSAQLTAGEVDYLEEKLIEYFGGIDTDYRGGVAPPECAEIIGQCIDNRFDGTDLSPEIQTMLQESFDRDEVLRECEYCGTKFRPYLLIEETEYVCDDDDCAFEAERNRLGLTAYELREYKQLEEAHWSGDLPWERVTEYLSEHTSKEELQ